MPRGQGQNHSPQMVTLDGPDADEKVTITLEAREWDALLQDKDRSWARQQAKLRNSAKNTIRAMTPNPEKRMIQHEAQMQTQRPFVDLVEIERVIDTLIDKIMGGARSAKGKVGKIEVTLWNDTYRATSQKILSVRMPTTTFNGSRLFSFTDDEFDDVEGIVQAKMIIDKVTGRNSTRPTTDFTFYGEFI